MPTAYADLPRMSTPDTEMLRAALAYVERGWFVLPLHTPEGDGCSCGRLCDSPGKHPRTLHGVNDASIDPGMIERWLRMWPQANIGIATGAESRVVVLDVDDMLALKRLEATGRKLPETAMASTGRGIHAYLQYPSVPTRNSTGALGRKLDIRGDGGYVVAPPSWHANGAIYRWISPQGVGPARCPEWLVEALTSPTTLAPSAGHQGVIATGMRNSTLFRLGCAMRHWGASPEAILAALEVDNAQRCQPPLDAKEVQRIAASVARYEPGALRGDIERSTQRMRLNSATGLRDLVAK